LARPATCTRARRWPTFPRLIAKALQFRETSLATAELVRYVEDARRVQSRALPEPIALTPDLSIAAANIPATYLSGDWVDYVRSPDGQRLSFFLCDVTRKSIPAALVAMHLARTFRFAAGLGKTLEEIDADLHSTAKEVGADRALRGDDLTATGVLGELDVTTERLRLLNAGHPLPSLNGANAHEPAQSGDPWGMELGPSRSVPTPIELHFGPGSSLVVVSDGITENKDASGGQFGSQGVQKAHRDFRDQSARELCDRVLYEAFLFGQLIASGTDDMTVLAIHWRA
jgi:serine phosphatase RsbU (regulator of sigma subunit)